MSDFAIETLSIHHYKSIRRLQRLKLDPINVLIGANGAGKSNFVSFFTFMADVVNQRLQTHIEELGGAKRGSFRPVCGTVPKGTCLYVAKPTFRPAWYA